MNQPDQMRGAEGAEIPDAGRADYKPGTSPAVMAVVIIVVLAVQVVSSYFIMKQLFFSKPPAGQAGSAQTETPAPLGEVFQLSGIIVNPTGSRGSRHLLVDVGIEAPNMKVLTELARLEPQLQDNLITFLTAQKVEVLTDIQMREKIRGKVTEIVNFYLTSGKVERIFFIRYVFQ